MEITLNDIEQNVNSWVTRYLQGFTFRQYQFEYICKTLYSLLSGTSINIIEAPTGSGKSILIIIMAGVLDKFYHKTSYILCSDLYLWQQYSDAIDKYNLYFGKIKGTTGNYVCDLSGTDFSLAPCRLAYIPYSKLFNFDFCMNEGWSCATTCDYIRQRKKAMYAPVTVMTYQLYFPYMNDFEVRAAAAQQERPFSNRDVIFCDECHNVPELCQQYGTIPLDKNKDLSRLRILLEFCEKEKFHLYTDIETYLKNLSDIYDEIMDCPYTEQDKLYDLLSKYKDALPMECYIEIQDKYIAKMKKPGAKKLTKREYAAIDIGKWLDKHSCSIKIFLQYSLGQTQYLVKTDNRISDPANPSELIWPDFPIVCYKFAREDVWVNNFLLKHQDTGTILLSATVGDKRAYDSNIGTNLVEGRKSEMFVIPSTFDFSKSPIYYIPGNKMSRDYIDESLKKNAAIINSILKSPKHANEKGIIHTGSYKIAYKLIEYLDIEAKKRIHVYSTSKEKEDILWDYTESNNGVLIGPTLTEGIDFPNDGCRFIIILKIPYPYLGDNLVKAKCRLFPRWYNSETSNNVIQGIGRGNRTPDDWSTTYILDGSFSNLYQETRNQYAPEMKERMQILTNNKL